MSIKCCIESCSETFEAIDPFRIHFQTIHGLDNQSSFKCQQIKCGSSFLHLRTLIKHLKNVHKIKKYIKYASDNDNIQTNYQNVQEPNLNESQIVLNEIESIDNSILHGTINNSCSDYLKNEIESVLFNFLVKLHKKSNMTKKIIIEIFTSMKEDIIDKLMVLANIDESMRSMIDNCYKSMNSQHKFEKMLNFKGMIANANKEIISHKIGNKFKHGISMIDEIKETISIMPIHHMLNNLFSLPNILNDVQKNIEKLSKSTQIENFVNSKRWKSIIQNYQNDQIVIPFDLYTDDFETGNSLGSNAGTHKVSAYYISFPVFPTHLQSSTKYVFECLLHISKLKQDEFKYCLEKLIDVFLDLESNGMMIQTQNQEKKVYFVLGRIIGDNLALNEIMGFNTSFNSNKYCRLCDIDKNSAQRKVISTESDLRTIADYEENLKLNDSRLTGIRNECYFNVLNNFHCNTNIVCDLMHDIYEGIAKYDLALCLKALLDDKNLKDITLDNINVLKQNFDYGNIEIGNLSKPIQEHHIKAGCLKMSASECRCFLSFLPLMIGNLVPKNNKYWKHILKLVDLSDRVMIAQYDEDRKQKLKQSIISYNSNFLKLFGKNLRPKHHLISHYIECIEYNGPLRSMMSFVYECKNKEVKSYAYVTNQRINIAKTLMSKAVMRFNTFLLEHTDGFPPKNSFKKTNTISLNEIEKDEWCRKLIQEDFDILKSNIQNMHACKLITHKNSTYKIGNFIVDNQYEVHNVEKIMNIFIIESMIYFLCEIIEIDSFDEHYRCYKVGSSTNICKLVNIDTIRSLPYDLHKTFNGNLYLKIKFI